MTIEIPLPDVSEVPLWVWIVGGILLWYFLAGVFVRTVDYFFSTQPDSQTDRQASMTVWAASPLIVTVIPTVFIGGTIVWLLSCGVITPPWKWKMDS